MALLLNPHELAWNGHFTGECENMRVVERQLDQLDQLDGPRCYPHAQRGSSPKHIKTRGLNKWFAGVS